MRGWAEVGLWVAVCFLAKISLHMHRPKTMFAPLTQSHAISQSFSRFHHFQMRDTNKFHFLHIFRNSFLYKIIVSFAMVIKRSPGGKSAGGGRSTSKPTCVVPPWTLTAFDDRPAPSMSTFSARVNSDLGNGSFWVEISDAERVDRCSWKCTRLRSYQLTSDLRDVYFFGYACNGHVWKQFRCLRLS